MTMQALDQILELTETVEQHVERGEWAEASALDAERCRLLEELFRGPASSGDLATYREVLQNLLMRNRRTVRQVESRKLKLVAASGELGKAASAMNAYQRNARPDNLVYLREPRVNES